jgi:hypothetical protein
MSEKTEAVAEAIEEAFRRVGPNPRAFFRELAAASNLPAARARAIDAQLFAPAELSAELMHALVQACACGCSWHVHKTALPHPCSGCPCGAYVPAKR